MFPTACLEHKLCFLSVSSIHPKSSFCCSSEPRCSDNSNPTPVWSCRIHWAQNRATLLWQLHGTMSSVRIWKMIIKKKKKGNTVPSFLPATPLPSLAERRQATDRKRIRPYLPPINDWYFIHPFKKKKGKNEALFKPENKVFVAVHQILLFWQCLQHRKIQPYTYSLPSDFFLFLPSK